METPIQEDGSSQDNAASPFQSDKAAVVEKSNEQLVAEGHPTIHDPRQAIMDAAQDYADERRTIMPGSVTQEEMPMGEPVPALEAGLNLQEQLHEPEDDPAALPEEFADDPLAEFLVMDDNDQVMFRAKVNGKEELIPLEKARAAVQKHAAADQRLQDANAWQKNLEQRQHTIEQTEKDLQSRLQQMHTSSQAIQVQPSPDAALDDASLELEARDVVKGLFTGTEDEASAKLAALLKKTRGAQATPVDAEAIAAKAVTAARNQLSAEAQAKDIKSGYETFSKDYPELVADENLFRYADSLTESIKVKHPDWAPSKVMLEAGKKTREWVNSVKTPEQQTSPNNDRLERKRTLRPIPRLRQGTQQREPEATPDTPADVLAGIRATRGQVA